MSRPGRLGGRFAAFRSRLKAAFSSLKRLEKLQLVYPFVLVFLMTDVLSNLFLITPNRRNIVAAGPEVLTNIIALLSRECACDVNRTFPFDEPDDLRDCILRRDRDRVRPILGALLDQA